MFDGWRLPYEDAGLGDLFFTGTEVGTFFVGGGTGLFATKLSYARQPLAALERMSAADNSLPVLKWGEEVLSDMPAGRAWMEGADGERVLGRQIGVTNNGLTISSNAVNGSPSAIARGFGELSTRQSSVLEALPEYGSTTITGKSFGQTDLAALTAATGDEFAMFTTGGRRLIYRGDASSVPITPEIASDLSSQGWRWSSHTHPGFEAGVLRSSPGDQAVLRAMGGNQSAIFNSMGQRGIFTPTGDSLNGWKPW